ncbi:MAG: hypothetical protein JRE47_14475, partial [Deltaproteobacteria bacterium]|nr:hypothetical protein [Deltaproteobacteria bacterium]
MKKLSVISKNVITICALAMIMAGAFVALLPATSQACGDGGMGEGTSYVNVPIL